jgi:hypothetical protein
MAITQCEKLMKLHLLRCVQFLLENWKESEGVIVWTSVDTFLSYLKGVGMLRVLAARFHVKLRQTASFLHLFEVVKGKKTKIAAV